MIKKDSWFPDWLHRAWPRIYTIIFNDKWVEVLSMLAGLGILAAIGRFVVALVSKDEIFLFYVNDVGHLILLIVGLVFFLPKLQVGKSEVPHEPYDPTAIAVKQFHHWIYGLVVLWVAFYVVRLFADLPLGTDVLTESSVKSLKGSAQILAPYVNVISAIPLFGLYVVLAKRSINEFFWGMGPRMWLAFVIILTVWAIQLWAYTFPELKEQDKLTKETLTLVAGIVNGIAVGGAISLVVGRLDSRYIGLSGFVVSLLYVYALIQPLYPIVFKPNGPIQVQYTFVGLALIMKCTLILTLGRIIDNRRFHFYVTNLRWLDAHATTMLAQHDAALDVDGVSRPMPALFCFVHPAHKGAILGLEHLDVKLDLTILNAWLGVGWDIKEFSVESLIVSSSDIPVKRINLVNPGTLRVEDAQRHTFASLYIDLAIQQSELLHRLHQDNRIADAIKRKRKTTRVNIVLKGIKAYAAILEKESLQHLWTPIEEVDGADGLFFECTIHLDKIMSVQAKRL